MKKAGEYGIVVLFLSLHFLMAFSSAITESPTSDEPLFITGGYNYWQEKDYRINSEAGILIQRWISLPLIFQNLKYPYFENESLKKDGWNIADHFLYKIGNNPELMVASSRLMVMALSVVLGLAVYLLSKSIFGKTGGIISLSLYAFSPSILASARLATSDLITSLAFLIAIWTFWKMIQKISIYTVLLSSLALSFLFLSKMSAFIIIPVNMILIVIFLLRKTPLYICVGNRTIKVSDQHMQLAGIISASAVNFLVVFISIWMFYGFRYSMLKDEQNNRPAAEWNWKTFTADSGIEGKIANFARKNKLLPEAYLYGFSFVMKHSKQRNSFLNGQYCRTGWWYFFPYAFLVKTPIPLLLIIIFSIIVLCFVKTKTFQEGACFLKNKPPLNLYDLSPFIVFMVVYFLFAMTSHINIGHRHILPVYPCFFTLAGALSITFIGSNPFLKLIKILTFMLLFWFSFESLKILPHYLAYFNQFAGGPKNGYKHLVDSSLDWGQDLKGLKKWIDKKKLNETGSPNIYLSYFGTANIDYYGLKIKKLPSIIQQEKNEEVFELKEGIYCISATMFQSCYFPEYCFIETESGVRSLNGKLFMDLKSEVESYIGKGNVDLMGKKIVRENGFYRLYKSYEYLRLAKLCQYLHSREPDDNVGYSILIYYLTEKDIKQAMQ